MQDDLRVETRDVLRGYLRTRNLRVADAAQQVRISAATLSNFLSHGQMGRSKLLDLRKFLLDHAPELWGAHAHVLLLNKTCPHCQRPAPDPMASEFPYCPRCGGALRLMCPKCCRDELRIEAKFCYACGVALVPWTPEAAERAEGCPSETDAEPALTP